MKLAQIDYWVASISITALLFSFHLPRTVSGCQHLRSVNSGIWVMNSHCFVWCSLGLTACAMELLGHTNIVPSDTDFDIAEDVHNDGEQNRSSPGKGGKRCLWEASLSSLKSKRIKGCHLTDRGDISSDWGPAGELDVGDAALVDSSCDPSECKPLLDVLAKDVHPDLAFHNEKAVAVETRASTDFVNSNVVEDKREPKIFFMNISDENKKTWLRKVGVYLISIFGYV